jgi:MFS superfamily sulfate permease-like transporter
MKATARKDLQETGTPVSEPMKTYPDAASLPGRLKYFLNPLDGRYEDLFKGNWKLNLFRDFTAGLIVAMIAIPMAMGFAMASGLRPEQGIVGGAIAGMVGALWGGSKYQVYGPTAAFIPVIAGLMATYNFSFLVLASVISGVILMLMGTARLGRLSALVPHSIVVGFTIGIACVIALSQFGEVLGLKAALGYSFADKARGIWENLGQVNGYAIAIGLATFLITKYLLKVSPFIPAPLVALGAATAVSATVWSDKGLTLISDKYGKIPTDFWVFTPPTSIELSAKVLGDLAYFVAAIVFVSAVESLLCSRMADRLADNRGMPFNPSKELWGQGLVQIIVPMLNGFPHTGALARTATNVKVGAVSPMAGIFKAVLKLLLAAYLATYLEYVPMACIGGILLYVATAMVKPAEIREVLGINRFHVGLMIYTALAVVVTDFLTGVLSAMVIYAVLCRFLDKPAAVKAAPELREAYAPSGD